MSQLRCKPPALVALHCHCHIAALIANEACKVLPDELEDLTTVPESPRKLRQFEELNSEILSVISYGCMERKNGARKKRGQITTYFFPIGP